MFVYKYTPTNTHTKVFYKTNNSADLATVTNPQNKSSVVHLPRPFDF